MTNSSPVANQLSNYEKQKQIILQVWYNKGASKAYGFEKIVKLTLLISRYFFPAFHIGAYFGGKSQTTKDNLIEGYVFFKLILSISILYFQLFQYSHFILYLIIYLLIETLLYPAVLIFCSDFFKPPTSFKRDILFVFIDYLMVVIDFASLYLIANTLYIAKDIQVTKSLDSLYFSFSSALTIGFGDITVQTSAGKLLVISQAIISLVYGVLFLNFYASRIDKSEKED